MSDNVITERLMNIEFEGECLPRSMRGPNLRFKKNAEEKKEEPKEADRDEDLILQIPEERKQY